MRLFVAVKFSPEIEKSLTDLQDKMKENHITGNYTNCQNLHLTLAFIGEYNSPNKVMKALSKVEFEPFDRKPFKPHITVIRKAGIFSEQEKYIKSLKIENVKMTVEKFSLMNSHRENGKLIYTEIGNIKSK